MIHHLAVSGKIGSGKTTISKLIAKQYCLLYVSCGDYVRYEASLKNISCTRSELQRLGEVLVSNPEDFVNNLLHYSKWDKIGGLIIDGVRHLEVLFALRNKLAPKKLKLIYIQSEGIVGIQRKKIENISDTKVESLNHPVERQICLLESYAEIVVNDENPPDEQLISIMHQLSDEL